MALTPIDIHHTQFKSAFKGYNKSQVDEFVKTVCQALEEALAAKCELEHKIDEFQVEVDRVRKIESAMSDALTLAQRSADETKANAHKQAELILAEAEQARVRFNIEAQRESERCRADIELLQSTKDRFECEFKGLLCIYMDWIDRRKSDDMVRSEVA